MHASIEKIIANDKKARSVVEMAEKYRVEAEKTLKNKEDDAVKKLNDKVKLRIEETEKDAAREKKRLIEEKKKKADAVCQAMELLYSEKKNEWIDAIFERVVND